MSILKSEDEIRKVTESLLTIGISTPEDVYVFLDIVEWLHSELVNQSELRTQVKLPFDSIIYSSLPAPAGLTGWLGLIQAIWLVRFCFIQNKLTTIEIELGLTGP